LSTWDTIVDFFTGRGWSRAQAQGIAGNLYGESGFKTNAVGDGGKAYGLAQWHPDRQANFKNVFGKSIEGSTLLDQLAFIDWELNNTERKAGKALSLTSTVEEATRTFMKMFERPANMSSFDARLKAAHGSVGNGFRDWQRSLFGDNWFTQDITDPTGITTGISDLFNGKMAARFTGVTIGVVLIALAIAAFVLTSSSTKEVIRTVGKTLP
jgi:hypothetical protein